MRVKVVCRATSNKFRFNCTISFQSFVLFAMLWLWSTLWHQHKLIHTQNSPTHTHTNIRITTTERIKLRHDDYDGLIFFSFFSIIISPAKKDTWTVGRGEIFFYDSLFIFLYIFCLLFIYKCFKPICQLLKFTPTHKFSTVISKP